MGDWEASSPAAFHCSQCRVSSAEICKAATQETQQHGGLGGEGGQEQEAEREEQEEKEERKEGMHEQRQVREKGGARGFLGEGV